MIRLLALILLLATGPLSHGDLTSLKSTLVVVGIQREAKVVRAEGRSVLISGASPERLKAMLEREDPAAVRAIVSFGVAGGLNPAYGSGDLVIPRSVITEDGEWETDRQLRAELVAGLRARGLPVHEGVLLGVNEVIPSSEAKLRMHRDAQADAVDMESHVAADFARRNGIPFLVARAISDPAIRALPSSAAVAISPSGRVRGLAVMLGLLRDPTQIVDLLQAGRDAKLAFRSLDHCEPLLLR